MGCCFACFCKKNDQNEVNDNDIVSSGEVSNATGKDSSVFKAQKKDTQGKGI